MCDQCAGRITAQDLKIAQAIEANKDAFMALMDKIRLEAGGNFMTAKAKTKLQKDLAKEQNHALSNMLLGTFVVTFMGEQLIDPNTRDSFPQAMTHAAEQAIDHGHMYVSYKHSMRH